jgi:8-hydroxy-5-deazaflavin:NADPH oxidoreductase
MKVAILGTGDVGRSLGKGFLALGHEVKMGARDAHNEKAAAWVKEMGGKASAGTFADAAAWGDIAALATLGTATEEVVRLAGPGNLAGKVLIDATNPLDFSGGAPPKLFVGHTDSLGERVQRAAPDARVVKAFNTAGNSTFFKPDYAGGPPDMFICGDNAEAKKTVAGICKDFGWGVVDCGGIAGSRYTEPLCIVWVMHGVSGAGWNHAFKFLHR